MNIALIAATSKEIQPTLTYLSERIYLRRHQRVEVIITGVGQMNTTYCLTKQFAKDNPPWQYRPELRVPFILFMLQAW
jgi:hypothetical protein